MKVALFDFQKDALRQLREALVMARGLASCERPQAIAFSAPTGSGKTLVMTALFEAILSAPDEQLEWPLDWPPQPDAAILWVSDMPELNEQTRLKIERTSDRVHQAYRLVLIDAAFDAERLEGGRIYFVNTQKLGSDKRLTRVGDARRWSIWETLANTARAIPDRFYVVIDEAHRGMAGRGAKEAQTLMQRFLLGHKEAGLPPMPLVIGVSATPRRFLELLDQAPHSVHKVAIAAEAVRASGLLKDRILIHYPDSPTLAPMSLLEEAARRWAQMTEAWGRYCQAEGVPRVWPVLVVQVENATAQAVTRTNLAEALDVIERAIGRRLNEGEAAHAMHDAGDLDVEGRRLRRVEASRIEADKNIGVVFFKTSLSTGWDCPRAEVMMSFRAAADHTYIAQLLGRMVRTPLARRIERDARLNDVHLYLPYFDAQAVRQVVDSLANVEDVPPAETGPSRELVVLARRAGMEAVFAALAGLATYRVNAARAQSPLRRYMALSRQLTLDEIDEAAWDEAKRAIVGWMAKQIAALRADGRHAAAAQAIARVDLITLAVDQATGAAAPETDYAIEAVEEDIDRQFEAAGRTLSHGLHMAYWQANAEHDAFEVKLEAIALTRDPEAMAALEAAAEQAFDRLYDRHKRAIAELNEQRRGLYERLRLATAQPRDVPWRLPESIDFRREPTDPEWERHLYVEADGRFRAALGAWEAGVLREELANPEVIGWLRNLPKKPWSLEIPYESGGAIRPMFPDLVIVRRHGDRVVADILEPHDPSLADNVDKARGLARFAERHGALFGRIQLIRKQASPAGGARFVRLEINRTATIRQLRMIANNAQLDEQFAQLGR